MLVNHQHQLLLNVTYPVPDCRLMLETTQLRNLYLANLTIPERRHIVNEVSPREVNMQRELAVALEYATY